MTQSVNEQIGTLPAIKSELDFAKIGWKMLGRKFVPRSDNPALKHAAENALDRPKQGASPVCP